MGRSEFSSCLLISIGFALCANAAAWWSGGHEIVSRAAAEALPGEVPSFFRGSAEALAKYSLDPDDWKNRKTPHLRDGEYPEHYIDYELLEGRALPPLRWRFIALCAKLNKDPRDIGLLPYAVTEATERLSVAFAQYRQDREDDLTRRKCLVYGGILAHYAADLAQPLHLTVHWDGRVARPTDPSPRTGIHNRLDALLQASGIAPREIADEIQPAVFNQLFNSIVRQVVQNRRAIDTVYGLESKLPRILDNGKIDPSWKPDDRVRDFAIDRARAATFLVASCWLTAWKNSAGIDLPHRPTAAGNSRNRPGPGRPRIGTWTRAILVAFLVAAVLFRLGSRRIRRYPWKGRP